MNNNCCRNRCDFTGIAIVASLIIGIIAAFLTFSATITLTSAFLWVTLGIGVVYLAVALVSFALMGGVGGCNCLCRILTVLLIAILGTILFSLILLGVAFGAASTLGAIFSGGLIFFLFLIFTTTANLINCLADCEN